MNFIPNIFCNFDINNHKFEIYRNNIKIADVRIEKDDYLILFVSDNANANTFNGWLTESELSIIQDNINEYRSQVYY